MAFSFQASRKIYSVHAGLKSLEDGQDIHSSRAGHFNDFNECRVIEPHRTCQVRSAVRSELATESHNLRFKAGRLYVFLYRLLCCFHPLLLERQAVLLSMTACSAPPNSLGCPSCQGFSLRPQLSLPEVHQLDGHGRTFGRAAAAAFALCQVDFSFSSILMTGTS